MPILDNHSEETCVGEYLRRELTADTKTLRIVSAYFTVYAYQALQSELENPGKVRFLFGDPESVGEIDPGEKQTKNYNLTEQGLAPSQTLQQKFIAQQCEKWINDRVQIRTIKQTNFLHGKMYHIERPNAADVAVLGSSNFTRRGLGFSSKPNLELNLPTTQVDTCDELKQWFDDVWRNTALTKDAKQKVLDALQRIGKNYSPQWIYFKTLLEIFRERLESRKEIEDQVNATHLKDTQIWKTLYQFQRDGVTGIINRLEQHKGCILADSVGLGKTYTALAVIHYYEAKNIRVLVLCPKRLNENWKLYPAQFGQKSNPFIEDNFQYKVLHHTDLTRDSGESNGINLSGFDWAAYGLVVIDESHHFRNETKNYHDEDDNLIRRSRYQRLLNEVIKAGGETRVLMLSATPVNTSLLDLRNQIHVMTGGREDTFKDTLGIGNVRAMMKVEQKKFKQWEEQPGEKDKRVLFDQLSIEFLKLLDATSIARSRKHVKKFYPEVVAKIGGFPKHAPPENKHPLTDTKQELSYQMLNEKILQFQLSIYTPAAYAASPQLKIDLKAEKEEFNFNQADRERWLIGMIRVNFLKRLESAAPSLVKTLQRTIDKIDNIVDRINAYQLDHVGSDDASETPDEDLEDEEFIVNKARRPLHFKDLNLNHWLSDLKKDRQVLENVRAQVAEITPQRDGKLIELAAQIREKLQHPTKNKDGVTNRKVLIFTAFKDTAIYLHKQLGQLLDEQNANYAMVAGDETKTSYGTNRFNDILNNFAPIGRGHTKHAEPEIDVLIATDCVSEGQNLQDCDLVINYDIHWNPVRLIQRFGRIDRIGSRNHQVCMVNYWPTRELDDYLKLQGRVEARMMLVDATATGDDTLAEDTDAVQSELNFRDNQLRRMRDEVLEMDDLDDGIALSDFSLDDFLAQLTAFLEQNRRALEDTPLGVYAVADCARHQQDIFPVAPGVIFCLRHKNPPQDQRASSPLKAYYLAYVRDDGEVRYNYTHAKQILELFGQLAREEDKPLLALCDVFDRETKHGKNMKKYNGLLDSAFSSIREQFTKRAIQVLNSRDGILPEQSEQPRVADDFELVTWLVIKSSDEATENPNELSIDSNA